MGAISLYMSDLYACECVMYECDQFSSALETTGKEEFKDVADKLKVLVMKAVNSLQEAIKNILNRTMFMLSLFKNRKTDKVKAYKPIATSVEDMVLIATDYTLYLTKHVTDSVKLAKNEEYGTPAILVIEDAKKKTKEMYDKFMESDATASNVANLSDFKNAPIVDLNVRGLENELKAIHSNTQKQLSSIKAINNALKQTIGMSLNSYKLKAGMPYATDADKSNYAAQQTLYSNISGLLSITNYLYSIGIKMIYKCQVRVNQIIKNPPASHVFDSEEFVEHEALPAST